MVHLSKPDKIREDSFTYKTGRGNSEADVVKRMFAYKP